MEDGEEQGHDRIAAADANATAASTAALTPHVRAEQTTGIIRKIFGERPGNILRMPVELYSESSKMWLPGQVVDFDLSDSRQGHGGVRGLCVAVCDWVFYWTQA
eukprot:COSAG06_NODE_2655_length_6487_cov_123.824515_3_plen_104_part_00